MIPSVASYLSAALASILFLLFHYGLVFPARNEAINLMLALGLAAAAYFGLLAVLPRKKALEDELAEMEAFSGVRATEAAVLIRSTMEKINTIRDHGGQLNPAVNARIERIADIAEAIVEEFKTDPSDINRSKHFLYHYLDAAIDIIDKYRELLSKNGGTQIQGVLRKSEQTLAEIEMIFEKQYQRNLENEAMELDVNLDVLKNMIKSEGL